MQNANCKLQNGDGGLGICLPSGCGVSLVLCPIQQGDRWYDAFQLDCGPPAGSSSGRGLVGFSIRSLALVAGCTEALKVLYAVMREHPTEFERLKKAQKGVQNYRARLNQQLAKEEEAMKKVAPAKNREPKTKNQEPRTKTSALAIPRNPMEPPPAALSSDERRQLAKCEKTIERYAESLLEFAAALRTIRDEKLYRATHATLGAYLAERWRIDVKECSDKINALESYEATAKAQKKLGVELRNEGQLRALGGLEPDEKPEVLRLAVAKAKAVGEDLVARHILQAKKEFTTPAEDLERERERRQVGPASRAGPEARQNPLPKIEDLAPIFPRCKTIDQACCVLRSWISDLIRQFASEDLSELDEELYRQCQSLRNYYRPAIEQETAAADKKTARRAIADQVPEKFRNLLR